jgi:hypothetical protein
VTPFSLQAQEALDRVEDDAGRIELAVTLVTQALGQLERASINEQVDTIRHAGDRLQQIGDASPSIRTELERQLYNYTASQGGLMDDVRGKSGKSSSTRSSGAHWTRHCWMMCSP